MVILSGFTAPDQCHRRLAEGLMASETRGIQAAGSPSIDAWSVCLRCLGEQDGEFARISAENLRHSSGSLPGESGWISSAA